MYTYCGNEPVGGYDPTGYEDLCEEDNEDDNPLNDIGPVQGSNAAGAGPGTGLGSGAGSGMGVGKGTGKGLRLDIKKAESWLKSFAKKANLEIKGTGHVAGTQKHSVFGKCIKDFGNNRLRSEVSYKNGKEVKYGTPGSIRFDAVLYDKANKPIAAWDFKTGSARLTATRIENMQKAIGEGVEIFEIK